MATTPSRTENGAAVRGRIPELSGIEFTGHESVRDYAGTLRGLFRDLAFELEFGRGELYEVLSRQSGHPLLMGIDTRLRARRVCKRLDRLAALMGGGVTESIAFYREFRLQFAPAIQPQQQRPNPRVFNWDN
jgi:hypothetical protein